MMYAPPRNTDPIRQSLYDGITEWASHARQTLLVGIALAGLVICSAVVAIDWHRAPIAAPLFIAAAVGAWGLLEQRARTPHSAVIRTTQGLLVLLGVLGAIVAGFGLLFWVMGPAPVL